jgi:hypothetical protein
MIHNPYAAPESPVEQPGIGARVRPRAVNIAVVLLLTAFTASLLSTLFVYITTHGLTNGQAVLLLLGTPLLIAILVLTLRSAWKGNNLGRVVLTILLGMRVLVAVPFVRRLPDLPLAQILIYLTVFALLIAGVALLYTREARIWFAGGHGSDYRSSKRLTATSGLGQ